MHKLWVTSLTFHSLSNLCFFYLKNKDNSNYIKKKSYLNNFQIDAWMYLAEKVLDVV